MAHVTTPDAVGVNGAPVGGRFRNWLRRAGNKYVEGRTRTALARSARYIDMLSDEQIAGAGMTRDELRRRF